MCWKCVVFTPSPDSHEALCHFIYLEPSFHTALNLFPAFPNLSTEHPWKWLKFRQKVVAGVFDAEVNAGRSEAVAGSVVSAVAWRRDEHKGRLLRRVEQQKKTFNIFCLKAVSVLPSNTSPFVVAELHVSAGRSSIAEQTGPSKRSGAHIP